MDEWLARRAAPLRPHLGDHAGRWRRLAELLEIEYEEI